MNQIQQHNQDKFNFTFPVNLFEKGKNDKGEDVVWIEGLASSSKVIDADGEQMQPNGFDYADFLNHGYFNWEHTSGRTSKAILGQPTECRIVADGEDFDFYVKGFLYPSAESKAIVELANNLEKHGNNRKVQFSIEGKKLATDPLNSKKITKAKITGIAITMSGKCGNTWMNIIKGNYQAAFIEPGEEINAGQLQKATEIAMFLNKAGYTHEKAHESLIKGGYSSDTAMAALEVISPALPAYPAGTTIINVGNQKDLDKLLFMLDDANDKKISKGEAPDKLLRQAIVSIEICKEVPESAYRTIRDLNIILQK